MTPSEQRERSRGNCDSQDSLTHVINRLATLEAFACQLDKRELWLLCQIAHALLATRQRTHV